MGLAVQQDSAQQNGPSSVGVVARPVSELLHVKRRPIPTRFLAKPEKGTGMVENWN